MNELSILKETLNKSLSKKNKSASIAHSKSSETYTAGSVESDTHLLNYSSEQVALMLSTLSNDYKVNKVVTLFESEDDMEKISVSPITLKALIDHQIRTGEIISYEIINLAGEKIFSIENVSDALPLYKPELNILEKTKSIPIESYKIKLTDLNSIPSILKKYAVKAVAKNFPTADVATGYGTAVLTKDGTLYFGGQYSSFDHRIGFHSEVNTLLAAIMDGNKEISHLGVVSTKHTDKACNCCGICRQFIAEISSKLSLNIEIYTFALDNDTYSQHTIENYLPDQWTNKK